MIFHGAFPLPLTGLGGLPPSADVKQLQHTLKQLSALAADPSIDPGAEDGLVGEHTRTAVAAALRFIAPRLPSKPVQVAVTGLSVALPLSSDVDGLIRKNAAMITSAINIALATITPVNPPPPVAPTPWWQSTIGRGALLAFAGILTLTFVMHRRRVE